MIDVKKDQTIETQDNELIELFIEEGEAVLMLAESTGGQEVDYLASRNLTTEQIDALIVALQKAKEELEC